MGRRLWGDRAGCAAGVAFALGAPLFGAHVVTTDIYLTAAETLAGVAFVFAVHGKDGGLVFDYQVFYEDCEYT